MTNENENSNFFLILCESLQIPDNCCLVEINSYSDLLRMGQRYDSPVFIVRSLWQGYVFIDDRIVSCPVPRDDMDYLIADYENRGGAVENSI